MIVISNVRDADSKLYDEVWYITNTCPGMPSSAQHHPELAPNREKFFAYKRNELSLEELLDDYSSDLEMGVYDGALQALRELSTADKWIQLCCYCNDINKCHRGRLYTYLRSICIDDIVIV